MPKTGNFSACLREYEKVSTIFGGFGWEREALGKKYFCNKKVKIRK